MTRRRAALITLLATLAFGAETAHAQRAATLLERCCDSTLESGETLPNQSFTLRNTGTVTWFTNEVLVGTREAENRSSLFALPSWLGPGRPTRLTSEPVGAGQPGKFTFAVKAPNVATPTTFREHFQLLVENVEWFGPLMFVDYTVLPPVAPNVVLAPLPASRDAGGTLPVSAQATDNHAVARVEFQLDDGAAVVGKAGTDGRTYSAALQTDGLSPGPHRVTARATDRAGQMSTSEQVVTFTAAAAAPAPAPTPAPPTLRRLGPFKPLFASRRARSARAKVIGTLLAVELQATGGSRVEVACVKGCSRKRTVPRVAGRAPRRVGLTLKPAWRLKPGAVVEVRVRRAGFAIRYERYAFRRGRVGLNPRQTSSGCLDSIVPRRVIACPSA